MQTAAIYARVSSEGQRKNKSLENQIEKCRQYAQAQGFEVSPDNEFYDVFTGTKLQRPAFDRVKDVAGKVDAIVFHVVDRLSRADVLDTVQQIRWIEESGTAVHITNRGRVDTRDEMSLIMLILEVSAARKERDSIIRRTNDGRYLRVSEKGKLNGGATSHYGYDYDKKAGKLTLNVQEAPWVEKIFYWHGVERLGFLAIANRLQELNVPTKLDNLGKMKKTSVRCRWSIGTLSRMLKTTVYKGLWEYGKTSKDGRRARIADPGIVPRIVSDELWELCQEVNRSNRRNNNKGRQTYPALLYGRITCTQCGKAVHQRLYSRDGRRTYSCFGQQSRFSPNGQTRLCSGAFDLHKVDKQVWDALAEALQHPDRIIEGFKADRAEKLAQTQYDRDYLDRCKSELAKLDTRLARNKALYYDGSWSIEELNHDKALIQIDRQMQLDKIAELERGLVEVEQDRISLDAFVTYCERISKGIEVLTPEEKREVIEALNVSATLHRGPTVRRGRYSYASGTLSLKAIVPLDIVVELDLDDANHAYSSASEM